MHTVRFKSWGKPLVALSLLLLGAALFIEFEENHASGALEPAPAEGAELPAPDTNFGVVPGPALLGHTRKMANDLAQTEVAIAHDATAASDFEPHPPFHFQVLSIFGKPVQGAVACDAKKPRWRSPVTDAEGRAIYELPDTDVWETCFVALAYKQKTVIIRKEDLLASERGEPMVVRLERDTLLTLTFRVASETEINGLRVELGTPIQLMAQGTPGPSDLGDAMGTTRGLRGSWGRGNETVTYALDESKKIVISGIAVGAPLELKVMDEYAGTVWLEDLVALREGEKRVHDVVLQRSPRSFSIRVRDEMGANVVGAKVVLRFREKGWRNFKTDEQGLVAFERLWAASGRLEVTQPGFVPIRVEGFQVPVGGVHEVTLASGYPVHLVVEDAIGQRPPWASPSAEWAGVEYHNAQGLDDGTFLFDRLPAATLELRVRVGGREYTTLHDSRLREARILIFDHGSIEATLSKPLAEGHYLSLLPVEKSIRPDRTQGVESVEHYGWLSPGDYDLCIQRLEGDKGWDWRDVTKRQRVRVRNSERTRVRIDY